MASFTSSKIALTQLLNKLTTHSHHVIQNTSKQDFATSGSHTPDENTPFDFVIVADSHGGVPHSDYYTKMFANIKWGEFIDNIFTDSDIGWREKLMDKCNIKENTYRIGTTFTCVKITPEHFEVTWIGDSSAKIYKDGELVWKTKDHDYDNTEDIEKYKLTDNFKIKDAWDIQATSSTLMTSKKAKLISINFEGTNMTRCLGHKGHFARLGFETKKITREEGEYKVVVASDGFWQVMSDEDTSFICDKENTAEILTAKARQRWEQHWDHDDTMGRITKGVTIPSHNWDDVAVATWSN